MTRPSIRPGARFHIASGLAVGADVALPPEAAHHAARVLRLREGEGVILFDGTGGEYIATLSTIARGEVRARTLSFVDEDREPPLRIELIQGVSSGDRMDDTVRKATELGVAAVSPVFTTRSVVKLDGARADRRRQHWTALAVAACEQCMRNRIPTVAPLQDFGSWIASLPAPAPGEHRLMLAPGAAQRLVELQPPAAAAARLLVGPEGGLTPAEAETAAARGFVAVRLGPRILRTETAGATALAVLQTLWGDF